MIALHRYPDLHAHHEAVTSYAAWVTRAMERDLYLGWVAESAGEVVGGCGLVMLEWGPTREDPSPWRGRIVNVYTASAVRRQGVARLLLGHALQEARQRGLHTLSLGTTEMARGLYEQVGFRPSGSELVRRSVPPPQD